MMYRKQVLRIEPVAVLAKAQVAKQSVWRGGDRRYARVCLCTCCDWTPWLTWNGER